MAFMALLDAFDKDPDPCLNDISVFELQITCRLLSISNWIRSLLLFHLVIFVAYHF